MHLQKEGATWIHMDLFPLQQCKWCPSSTYQLVWKALEATLTRQEGRDNTFPVTSLGPRGSIFSQFSFLPLSVAAVAHNTRHRGFGNKRNRRHCSFLWHKCRAVSCDTAHWLPASCLLAVLFPSTALVRASTSVLLPLSPKVTFSPSSLPLRGRNGWHLSLSGDWEDMLPLQCLMKKSRQQQSVSWSLPSFALQKICA